MEDGHGQLLGRQSAFPVGSDDESGGMTLRVYLATHALAGLLANGTDDYPLTTIAKRAVAAADLLLAELAKPKAGKPPTDANDVPL